MLYGGSKAALLEVSLWYLHTYYANWTESGLRPLWEWDPPEKLYYHNSRSILILSQYT